MTYTCWFYVEVRCWDGQATFEKQEDLPFPPAVGIAYVWSEGDTDIEVVRYIEYSIKDDCFWCWCEPIEWTKERHPGDRIYPLSEAKASYKEKGWSVYGEAVLDKDDKKRLDTGHPGWRSIQRAKNRDNYTDIWKKHEDS